MSKRPISDATRMIRSGKTPATLVRTVGPPIQKGSTVLLPNAAVDAKGERLSTGKILPFRAAS